MHENRIDIDYLNDINYVDSRVNLEFYLNGAKKGRIKIEEDEYGILTKFITYSPLWNSFELVLDSNRLRERAEDIKKRIIDVIHIEVPHNPTVRFDNGTVVDYSNKEV